MSITADLPGSPVRIQRSIEHKPALRALYRHRLGENRSAKGRMDSGSRGCVAITASAIKDVIPAKAGIQNLLEILDFVLRFACTK